MLDGCGTHAGEARMNRGRWSGLGLTALHTAVHIAAWLVCWRGDGGERKAEEAMEAAGVPSAAQGRWCMRACILEERG